MPRAPPVTRIVSSSPECDPRRRRLLSLPRDHEAAAVPIPDLEEAPLVQLVEEAVHQVVAVARREVEHPHVAVR